MDRFIECHFELSYASLSLTMWSGSPKKSNFLGSFGEPDHIHWGRGVYDAWKFFSWWGGSLPSQKCSPGFLNSPRLQEYSNFWALFRETWTFLVSLATSLEVEGLMIAQNDTLNEAVHPRAIFFPGLPTSLGLPENSNFWSFLGKIVLFWWDWPYALFPALFPP